ncbi:sensor histidine kinase [Clostridium oryzae]|nr:HAMP domain-containing sensor histidine kinase [Clostridium oryzae]
MKFNLGITKKLFIITIGVFAIFIGSTLLVQSKFFEQFYVYKKQVEFKDSLNKFSKEYNKISTNKQLSNLLEKYEDSSELKIIIMQNNTIPVYLHSTPRERNKMMDENRLKDYINNWYYSDNNYTKLLAVKSKMVVGRMKTPDRGDGGPIVGVAYNSNNNSVIFAMTSLKSVSEAVSIIKEFYNYFIAAALLLSVLTAFIYSRMIAKPLVRINKAAIKMAKLDFSEKCVVSSGDEIGSVAESLNILSTNLDNALTSLKEANVKLEEDIEKERSLEKMRKEFIASVSHELKTPISLIDGYAGGLKDQIFEDEDKDYYLDIIMDESKKMANLVSDMLDLSQLESGNFRLVKDEFMLTELIRITAKKYEAMIHDKGVTMELDLISNVKIQADWSRMEQVMTNFITNAIRHVSDNGTIFVRMLDDEENYCVEVENTGANIPEEELHKIWDQFYKIDKSRNRKAGGTGIGLSIVKNILMLHKYEHGVRNTDTGVLFYFKVPKDI